MADEIRATPQNRIGGLLSSGLSYLNQGISQPFGYQNPPGAMLVDVLGLPALQRTIERMSYGEPLTTGSGMTTRPRPDTLEAALAVAPASKVASKGGKAVARMAGEEINAAMMGERGGILGAITPQPMPIFIGENARTWSQANANKFLNLEKEGLSPIELWKQTGTFRTPDGQIKQEIPDNLARLRANFDAAIANKANDYKSGIEGPIGGMLEHSELFKAYPDLLLSLRYTANKQPDWLPESVAGGQYSKTYGGKEKISTSTKTEEDALSKLMHELQHAVQTREGWQSGGLESQFKDTPEMTAFQQYRALPGEVEARAVEARRTMTPEQRQQTFPLSNYDLPVESLMYRDPFGNPLR
jgi:hypothetical protein